MQTEEVLKSQNLLLTSIINSHKNILIFSLDNAYRYTAFNEMHREEMKKVWNADIQIGMNILEFMTKPELKKLAKQSIDRALSGEIFSEIQHQPESDIYYEFNWNPIWQNKEIVGVIALIKDITRSKQIEKDLIINEALFREYFDNMTSGSAIFKVLNDGSNSSDYIIKKINRVGLKMEGKELEEVVGKKFNDIRPAIDSYGLIPVMKKVWETGESAIFQTKLYSDERYSNYYENYVFKLPSGEVVTLYDDVTESKKAEKALQETKKHLEIRVQERTADLEQVNRVLQVQIAERKAAEDAVNFERQRLYDVLETLPVYVILLSADYHVPFANRFYRDRFGESEGRRCYEYLFHRDSPCEICETYTVLKTSAPHKWEWIGPDGRNYDIFDFLFTDRDGSPLVLEMGIDITDYKRAEEELQKAHNKLEQRVAERTEELSRVNKQLQKDITERKLAETNLRQALEWYEAIFEGSLDAIFISDQDSCFVAVNHAACNLTGYSREQLLKMRIPDIHDLLDLDAYKLYHQRIFGGEEILSEAKVLRSDGVKSDTEFNNKCVSVAGKLYMHTTAHNITERKLSENKVKEKISEIERFNNLMIGRELRMIELKKEINELLVRLGEKKKYRIPK